MAHDTRHRQDIEQIWQDLGTPDDLEDTSSSHSMASDLVPQNLINEGMNTYNSDEEEATPEVAESHSTSNKSRSLAVKLISPGCPTIQASKFEKPSGEPGRPKCGGYNLKSKLVGWDEDLYQKIYVRLLLLDVCDCLFSSRDLLNRRPEFTSISSFLIEIKTRKRLIVFVRR